MMRGNRSFWSMNAMMSPPAEQNYCLLPYQDPPLSWSQLLLGGSCASEEEKHDTELIEGCWEEQIGNAGTSAYMEAAGSGCMIQSSIQPSKCSWSHQVLPPSISTTLSNNLLEFSNSKSQHNSTKPADSSSEIFKSDFSFLKCNSTATGGALKKARVQGSFTAQSTLKVRKEKLGDRIIALHQIVSPFGKTDTASVLLEAIGYIRFLHSQIEALTSPYSSSVAGNMKQPSTFDDHESLIEEEKDLRSRGLCLMPLPFISHVGRDFGGNYLGSF
ncbi:transcription factor bHLH68-like isoform X2 [Zingiber officinale]|uniref:transcription factor bHLH68-like isoform X2 n=1 Tax=Zingiber officinale TaxID=94328 RepID=UPI001C4DB9F4|nr:transcription factor bHLH68-like isoform X2 [Zingiber officinale]